MTARFSGSLRAAVTGALVATAALTAPALASAALTGPQQIAFLNAQRAAHGFPADIVEVPALSDGCRKHMDYLAANGLFQHDEDPTKVEYTGYTPEGDAAGNSSVLVSAGDAFSSTGVNAFQDAPIHLMQMLSPFITQSGADRGCLVTQGSVRRTFATPTTFSYPGDGATVPVSASAYESPFVPAASVGLNTPGTVERSSGTGPHLYFFYAGNDPGAPEWFSRGAITAATLTGPSGPVDIRTVDNNTPAPAGYEGYGPLGLFLSPGGIVLPVAPLANNSTFSASVTFQPKQGPAAVRTWTIKTGTGAAAVGSLIGTGGSVGPGGSGGSGGSGGPGTTPTPIGGLPPAAPIIPSLSALKLKARSLSFKAPLTGKGRITVEQQTTRKDGTIKSVRKLRKTVKMTSGKTVKLTFGKLPKGQYVVSANLSGVDAVVARSSAKRG